MELELPKGWRYVVPNEIDVQLGIDILDTYKEMIPDSQGFLGFVTALSLPTSFLAVHDDYGWVVFDEWTKGASVRVHGAKWSDDSDARGKGVRALLDFAFKTFDVPVMIAEVWDHAKGAQAWCEAMGFEPFGVVPCAGTFAGTIRGKRIYAKAR